MLFRISYTLHTLRSNETSYTTNTRHYVSFTRYRTKARRTINSIKKKRKKQKTHKKNNNEEETHKKNNKNNNNNKKKKKQKK